MGWLKTLAEMLAQRQRRQAMYVSDVLLHHLQRVWFFTEK